MQTTTIAIRNMSCDHCVRAVRGALERIEGVREVRVTVGEAIVTTDGPPDLNALRQAIRDEGYEVA